MIFKRSTPLDEVREAVQEGLEEGIVCPCCQQFAKQYRRKVTSTSARSLILMYQQHGTDWQHIPTTIGRQSADETKSSAWGLIEARGGTREDGSKKTGWWRVTDKGVAWIKGEIEIPKYVITYNGKILGFEGEGVTIKDALGTRFRYDDLMAGR